MALQVLEYELKPECLVILAEEEMVYIDLGFLICLVQPFFVHASFHTSTLLPILPLFQLQKVGLSSSLPICTQSTRAPSLASQRCAHLTLSHLLQ